MSKKSLIYITGLALATIAVFAACSIGTGLTVLPYALKVAPKAISVNVPGSLVQTSTTVPGASFAIARDLSGGGGGGGYFRGEGRGAFHWVKQTIWHTEKRLARAAATMVLIDTVIGAEGLAAGTAATPTHHASVPGHLWTDSEVAAYLALIPAGFADSAFFRFEARLPVVGDKVTIPAFDYSAVDKANDSLNAAYDIMISIPSDSTEDDHDVYSEVRAFYWNTAKDKFKFASLKVDGSTNPSTVLERNFVAYDKATATMAAGRSEGVGSMSMAVAADPASTTNGVFITFSASINASKAGEDEGDASVTGATFSFDAAGYADSAGGYIDETLVFTPPASSGASPTTYYFRESFDASGHLTLVQSSGDSTFTNLTTLFTFPGNGHHGDYDGKHGEVEKHRQDLKDCPVQTQVQDEVRHAGL